MATVKCFQHPETTVDTATIPDHLEGIYCAGDNCGLRLGWYDESHGEQPVAFCDCCAADEAKKVQKDEDDAGAA